MENVGSWQHATSLFAHMLTHYNNIHISGQEQLGPSFLSFLTNVKFSPIHCVIFKWIGRNPIEVGNEGRVCDLYHINL